MNKLRVVCFMLTALLISAVAAQAQLVSATNESKDFDYRERNSSGWADPTYRPEVATLGNNLPSRQVVPTRVPGKGIKLQVQNFDARVADAAQSQVKADMAPWAEDLEKVVSQEKGKYFGKKPREGSKGLDKIELAEDRDAILKHEKEIKKALTNHPLLKGYYVRILDIGKVGPKGLGLLKNFLTLSPSETHQDHGAPIENTAENITSEDAYLKPPFYQIGSNTARDSKGAFKTMSIFLCTEGDCKGVQSADLVATINPYYGRIELISLSKREPVSYEQRGEQKISLVYYIFSK